MRASTLAGLLAFTVSACGKPAGPDAYGNVEATEVVVSAQAGGQLTAFAPQEGQTIGAGAVVGAVDSSDLALQRDQAAAQRATNASRVLEVGPAGSRDRSATRGGAGAARRRDVPGRGVGQSARDRQARAASARSGCSRSRRRPRSNSIKPNVRFGRWNTNSRRSAGRSRRRRGRLPRIPDRSPRYGRSRRPPLSR